MSVSFYGGFMPGTFPGGGGSEEASRGIASTMIDENGQLIITYTDGTSQNVGKVVGEDGITFTPIPVLNTEDSTFTLSWTNDGDLPNPDPVQYPYDAPDEGDYWEEIGGGESSDIPEIG